MCQNMIPFVIKSPRYLSSPPPIFLYFSPCRKPPSPPLPPLSSLLSSLLTQIQISMRAGSLLVWDSRLLHRNYPNEADKFRVVQCISSTLSFSFLLFLSFFFCFFFLKVYIYIYIYISHVLPGGGRGKGGKRDSNLLFTWMMHQVLLFSSLFSFVFFHLLSSPLLLVFFPF